MAIQRLETNSGDGSVVVSVDEYGKFSSAVYDPLGLLPSKDVAYESGVYFRTGDTGRRNYLGAATSPGFINTSSTEAQSSFTIGNLNFALVQTLSNTIQNNQRTGSILTQGYSITNTSSQPISFELVRYFDGDLTYQTGLTNDGGGRLAVGSQDILFETDTAGQSATDTTFVGITSEGGNPESPGRFEADAYSGLQNRIESGQALDEIITGDSPDPDQFVDAGSGYDITLGLRNKFLLAPGESTTYTTKTIFGSGAPELLSLPPDAVDDVLTTSNNVPTTVSALGGVLTNDTDPENSPLIVVAVNGETSNAARQITLTSGALLTLNGDGSYVYNPNGQFNNLTLGQIATDAFTYTISDSSGYNDTATVRVNISNLAPDAVDDAATTGKNTPIIVSPNGLLANDIDPENNPLTVVAVNGDVNNVGREISLASGALLTLNADGSYVYNPNRQFRNLSGNQIATDSFTYSVKDSNGNTDTATVALTITNEPIIPPAPPNERKGESWSDPHIITFDRRYYSFQEDGEFVLVQSDTNDLNIQVRQQGLGNSSDASVNSAVATILDGRRVGFYIGQADTPLVIDNTPTTIIDGDFLDLGQSRIYRNGNEYTTVYATGDQLISKIYSSHINIQVYLSPTRQGRVSGLLGNFNFNGTDELITRDGQQLVQPISVEQLYTTFANSWRITQAESLFNYLSGQTTENFNDLNFPRVYFDLDDLDPSLRTAAEQQVLATGISAGSPRFNAAVFDLVITRNAEFLQGSLDAQTPEGIIEIAPNQLPIATNDSTITPVDTSTIINVLNNDTDPDGTIVRLDSFDATSFIGGSIVRQDNNQLLYTPVPGFNGTDSFNYRISDRNGDTAAAIVTVRVGNNTPVVQSATLAVNENSPVETVVGTVIATEPNNRPLNYTINTGNEDINGNGTAAFNINSTTGAITVADAADINFELIPIFNLNVAATNPDGVTGTGNIAVNLNNVNEVPIAANDTATANEDNPINIASTDILANDIDPDGNPLSVTAVDGTGTTGTVTLNGTTITYNPNAQFESLAVGQTAIDSFNYTVSDPLVATAISNVAVTITGVNDAPVAVNDNASTNRNTPVTITAAQLLANDRDPDNGDILTLTEVSNATSGSVQLDANGNAVFTPNTDFFGTASFTYTLSDNNGGSSNATVGVDVLNPTTEYYRFRNQTYSVGGYLYVEAVERDAILSNENFSQTFVLEGLAWKASTQPGQDLEGIYRIRSLDLEGTYLYVGKQEYDSIFAPNSTQQSRWVGEGLDSQGNDIADLYVLGAGSNRGLPINRLRSDIGTYIYTGTEETAAILTDPKYSNTFTNEGIAFEVFG